MLNTNSFALLVAAALCFGNLAVGQDCGACAESGCGTGFGYPGKSGHFGGSRHEKFEALKAQNAKIAARNDAWPKPFNCADRQLYHEIWAPMINEGFEEQCVLNETHFDSGTHELNRFGLHTVAGIVQNMPSHRKHVFVTQDADETITQARLANVQTTLQTYYGQIAPSAQVSLSTKQPAFISGVRAETISNKFISGQPVPNIPISSANSTVSSSINN